MVRRRVAREPVAYILGRKGFRHIELAVDRRALIPRPETELLVEVAVELAPASVARRGRRALAPSPWRRRRAAGRAVSGDGHVSPTRSSSLALNARRLSLDVDFRMVGAGGRSRDVERPVNGRYDLVW